MKKGGYVHNDITNLHEGTLFHGNENDFQLQGKYEKTFKCLFELKKFPFDTQHCTMNLKVPYEIRNFITLKPKNLSFTGKYFSYTEAEDYFLVLEMLFTNFS